jgi:hypothetical protein
MIKFSCLHFVLTLVCMVLLVHEFEKTLNLTI